MNRIRPFTLAALTGLSFVIAGCSAEQVADNTIDATLWTGKTVAKGAYGAGKLAVKGTSAAVRSATAN